MITGLFQGFSYVFKGLSLIIQPNIRPFVLVPLVINSVLFAGGIWLAKVQLDYWMAHLLPNWLSWLEWVLWPVFTLLIFFVVFYVFTIVANILAAPFNAVLAERVEARLKGLPVPAFAGYKSLPALVIRTFRSELSKLWYMGKWFVLLLLITLIPGINVIAPVAWTVFGAWMLAIEYADYPMGNHNLFFKDELATLRQFRAEALGFGWLLSVLTSIPVLNFLSMPVGVAGATALWVQRLSSRQRLG